MAAYAALLSLNSIMDQIQLYHARRPIFLEEEHGKLESLKSKVVFLQDFLESYSGNGSNVAESLESQIAEACYATEDIIETHVVDDIQARYRKDNTENNVMNDAKARYLKENSSMNIFKALFLKIQEIYGQRDISTLFSQKIHKIIENMDFIEKEAMKIKEKSLPKDKHVQDLEHVGSISPLPAKNDIDLKQIMEKLTRRETNLQVLSITGMGGIGKTTLARNVYDNSQHFDIHGWATISQDYNTKEALFSLLKGTEVHISENEKESLEYHQLGGKLYKHLLNRRYFIIIDDLWSVEAWDKLKLFLPDNNNSSRIIVTTRLLTVAKNICSSSDLHQVSLLDENISWSLLCEIVFGNESSCPPEFEEIGKDIAKKCKGLPLSIVVIGGLLAKSDMLLESWRNIAQHINSAINSEDGDRCLKILALSYNHLPVNLKPCFLYMGVFPEDYEIGIEKLIRLWVAEGFIKPKESKMLEEVAMDYLKDLADRNLVLVSEYHFSGNMSRCKMHDLLRDLCLREAQKDRFLSIMNVHNHEDSSSQCIRSQRRNVIPKDFTGQLQLESLPLLRSLIEGSEELHIDRQTNKLLRVVVVTTNKLIFVDCWSLNSRYLHLCRIPNKDLGLMWFLQTLDAPKCHYDTPLDIWEMSQLRHVHFLSVSLTDPLDGQNEFVLENLQTLSIVKNFRCTEKVLKKIPNIKELHISYEERDEDPSHYCLNNLGHLQKLQTLKIIFEEKIPFSIPEDFEFPKSLKELFIGYCVFTRDEMVTKIGPLPNLKSLWLYGCFIGEELNTVEGQFLSLKCLSISDSCPVGWISESSHFPQLEILFLDSLKLNEIPYGIGEIETLQQISLIRCSESLVSSAKEILNEQRSFGNEGFRVLVNGIEAQEETTMEEEEDDDNEIESNN